MFFWELCKIFKNTFFTEHLPMTPSDIQMQVVLIYNLNLSLQFLVINFEFSRWPMLQCLLNFYINLFFGRLFLTMSLRDSFWRKIIAKHSIQKAHIHIFHNRLLGEVAIILDVVSDTEVVMHAKVILTKNFSINTNTI